MGVDSDSAGEEFVEDRWVFADEFNGSRRDFECVFVLSDYGDGKGL